ncbi:MAG: Crp/Fnr family transcriptional regulator [Bacteroidia bacterium]|nr:Crp/Fnr family transcriptional regulator [Bacteroidia bacterium]
MTFLQYLETVISINTALREEINAVCEKTKLAKGTTIIEINTRCNDLFYIENGLIRGFYFIEDKEVTNWFAQQDEFATCFYSFIAQKPSFETIQAIEDCELIRIPHATLQKLYAKFPETERIGRIITENYYIKLEERLLSMQFKTAKERYQNLMETKPSLIQRAALGQIASYLGISQETLSRIRAEI